MNILIDNLQMQFFHIPNLKNILYQYFVIVFALLGTASPLKTLYMSLHSTNNLKKV